MERSTIFKNGKPSISIRAIEIPWRTGNVITRPGISKLQYIQVHPFVWTPRMTFV
jgi:hypothetical protein